jgi:hypothetical protein
MLAALAVSGGVAAAPPATVKPMRAEPDPVPVAEVATGIGPAFGCDDCDGVGALFRADGISLTGSGLGLRGRIEHARFPTRERPDGHYTLLSFAARAYIGDRPSDPYLQLGFGWGSGSASNCGAGGTRLAPAWHAAFGVRPFGGRWGRVGLSASVSRSIAILGGGCDGEERIGAAPIAPPVGGVLGVTLDVIWLIERR